MTRAINKLNARQIGGMNDPVLFADGMAFTCASIRPAPSDGCTSTIGAPSDAKWGLGRP